MTAAERGTGCGGKNQEDCRGEVRWDTHAALCASAPRCLNALEVT